MTAAAAAGSALPWQLCPADVRRMGSIRRPTMTDLLATAAMDLVSWPWTGALGLCVLIMIFVDAVNSRQAYMATTRDQTSDALTYYYETWGLSPALRVCENSHSVWFIWFDQITITSFSSAFIIKPTTFAKVIVNIKVVSKLVDEICAKFLYRSALFSETRQSGPRRIFARDGRHSGQVIRAKLTWRATASVRVYSLQ